MADRFIGSLVFRGSNGKTAGVRYNLVDTTFAEAKTALDNLATTIGPCTDAVLVQKSLAFMYGESNAAGEGDIYKKATIAVHTNATGNIDKFAVVNIPAPTQQIFLADEGELMDVIDPADTDLEAYIVLMATEVKVSDGELINTALGSAANGIRGGRRTLANVKLG